VSVPGIAAGDLRIALQILRHHSRGKPAMAFEHRQDLDRFIADMIDDSIGAPNNLANINATNLRNDTATQREAARSLHSFDQHLHPPCGSLRAVLGDEIADTSQIAAHSIGPLDGTRTVRA